MKSILLLPCTILVACVGTGQSDLPSDERSDNSYGETIIVKQECSSAEQFGIVDSFTIEYSIDSEAKQLVSESVAIKGFASTFFELSRDDEFASDETVGTLKASNWHVSNEMVTFDISDRDNGTTGDFMLVLAPDYDGERAIGFLKFTSDGFIGSSLVECDDFPFDDVVPEAALN